LYVSHACPWAHRTMIARALRGLEAAIPVTVVSPLMGDDGWAFREGEPDPLDPQARFLREVYLRADPRYTGRVTVPILWDTVHRTIVNNESREIIFLFDGAFEPLATRGPKLAPPELVAKIDETLDALYEPINNGVYRSGFATTQEAYETACNQLFAALDRCEETLGKQRYLCGETLTLADIALFTTLLRFDLVYYAHFKCNRRRIQDYPHLWGYLRAIYQRPEVRATCHLGEIKTHYYWSQNNVNPTRIVPVGPTIDLDGAHGR
jgi:putative glutathione S-transferase